jgi:hypothetical protein
LILNKGIKRAGRNAVNLVTPETQGLKLSRQDFHGTKLKAQDCHSPVKKLFVAGKQRGFNLQP